MAGLSRSECLESYKGTWGSTFGPLWGLVPTHSLAAAAAAAAAPVALAWLSLLWLLRELQGKLLRSGKRHTIAKQPKSVYLEGIGGGPGT